MKRTTADSWVHALPFAIAVVDRSARVVLANTRMERLTGHSEGELIGLALAGELIDLGSDVEAALREAIAAGSADLRFHGSVRRAGEGATATRVLLRSFSVDGEPHALVVLDDGARDAAGEGDEALRETHRRISKLKHGMNNLLMGLFGHIEFLRDTEGLPAPAGARVESLMVQATRLRDAVQQLDTIGEDG